MSGGIRSNTGRTLLKVSSYLSYTVYETYENPVMSGSTNVYVDTDRGCT